MSKNNEHLAQFATKLQAKIDSRLAANLCSGQMSTVEPSPVDSAVLLTEVYCLAQTAQPVDPRPVDEIAAEWLRLIETLNMNKTRFNEGRELLFSTFGGIRTVTNCQTPFIVKVST